MTNYIVGLVVVLCALCLAKRAQTIEPFGGGLHPSSRLVAPPLGDQFYSGEAVTLGRKCDLDAAEAWRRRFWLTPAEYEFLCDPRVPDRAKELLFARVENRKKGIPDIDPFEESIKIGTQRGFRTRYAGSAVTQHVVAVLGGVIDPPPADLARQPTRGYRFAGSPRRIRR